MSLAWPDWLQLFAPPVGVTGGSSSDDGVWTDDVSLDTEEPVFEGPAEVQDGGRMFDASKEGQLSIESDAVAFIREFRDIEPFVNRTGMRAKITWASGQIDIADVVRIRRLDGTIWMKRL